MEFKSRESLSGLTDDQVTAKGMMMQGHKIFILKGYAGTGKTYLLQDFIREVNGRAIVTAPTHKALGVAKGDCTIHSYLSLKLKEYQDKQVLQPSGFSEYMGYGDLVIIDEASMISRELLHYIMKAQDENNLKIIFIGDPAQIPPVGETISPVWELNAPTFTLTEIVRQAKGSNIISLATAIRDGSAYTNGVNRFVNNKDVLSGGMKEMSKFFHSHITEDDFPQIISYRNKIVNSSNVWARRIIKNNPTEAFLPGENVYVRTTGVDQIHKLEDIVRIQDISDPFKCPNPNISFPMSVIRLYVSSEKGEEDMVIPAADIDIHLLKKNKNDLAERAKAKKMPWGKFWKFSNSISELKHIYSMTCHRSQGSTFRNVIVNCSDIQSERLMYTAVTRASKKLFLLRT